MIIKTISANTVLYFMLSLSLIAQGPAGYTECEPEQFFTESTNVAFGNACSYKYLFNQRGPFVFTRGQFFGGRSPAETEKCWCQKIIGMDVDTPSARLAEAFTALKNMVIRNGEPSPGLSI